MSEKIITTVYSTHTYPMVKETTPHIGGTIISGVLLNNNPVDFGVSNYGYELDYSCNG